MRKALYVMQQFMIDTSQHITFMKLRQAYAEVKSFIEDETGDKVGSLKIKIADDLGCMGDDNLELLEKFVEKYKVGVLGFDYSKHFLSEGELFGSGAALLTLVTIPIGILIWTLKLLTFGKLDLNTEQLFPKWQRETSDLTFGDMLTWYLMGTYTLRSNVQIKIHKAA